MSGATLPVRIKVQDVWDEVRLDLPESTPVGEAKRRALRLTHIPDDPDRYLVKFRGAEVLDESRSLGQAGIVPNAALIVLSRRRRPVR